ncbi:hypothetical protein HispidOSU_028399, partial [Sigmodon hispidus]
QMHLYLSTMTQQNPDYCGPAGFSWLWVTEALKTQSATRDSRWRSPPARARVPSTTAKHPLCDWAKTGS